MTADSEIQLVQEILQIYHRVDLATRRFQLASGLRCPPGCGACCESAQVEASVLQCLPLAWTLFRRGKAEDVAARIENQVASEDWRCVLRRPAGIEAPEGRCGYYRLRPSLCRLFGFAARRNKYGELEPSLCRVARGGQSKTLGPPTQPPIDPATLPVYQDLHWQIAALSPTLGHRLLPINRALAEALDHVHWRFPRRPLNHRRAA